MGPMEKTYEVQIETESATAKDDGKAAAIGAAQIQKLVAADGHSLSDEEVLDGLLVEELEPGSTRFRVTKKVQLPD